MVENTVLLDGNDENDDAMVDIVPVKSTLDEIGKVCSGKKVDGKNITGFNVWSPDVVRIMETVCDGRYVINGFRNKDISRSIFPEVKDAKKRSSKTSQLLEKLRQHDLIKKVPRSRRYHTFRIFFMTAFTSLSSRVLSLARRVME